MYVIRNLKDGKVDGEKIEYKQDGVLKNKMLFKEDQLQKSTIYYANGNPKETTNYKTSKKDGLFENFSEKGIKIEEGFYKNDYKNGIWKRFDNEDAHLLYETTFTDNVKNGIAKEYNNANRISAEGMFKNNEKDGIWKHYNLAGKLTKEVVYNLGKEISTKKYK